MVSLLSVVCLLDLSHLVLFEKKSGHMIFFKKYCIWMKICLIQKNDIQTVKPFFGVTGMNIITRNVHRAYSREVPKSGVLPTVSGWAGLGCASCLATPLRIQCIRIYIGQIE